VSDYDRVDLDELEASGGVLVPRDWLVEAIRALLEDTT